jgi:PTEN induced putative kinase 1
MASGSGVLTKDDELEGVCWEIRDAVQRVQSFWSEKELEKQLNSEELGLNILDIGPPIAKGCSAVVYAAAFKNESVAVPEMEENLDFPVPGEEVGRDVLSPLPVSRFVHNFGGSVDNLHAQLFVPLNPSFTSPEKEATDKEETLKSTPKRVHFEYQEPSTSRWNIRSRTSSESMLTDQEENLYQHESSDIDLYKYPLALKMMFNYDIQSNAMAILKAMHKETVPARHRLNENAGNWEKK